MNLQEAFFSSSPDAHVLGAVMFIDMKDNSTAMKEKEAEAAWLNTLAALYDIIVDKTEKGKKIVKFLGDGAMAFYGEEEVTEAMNDSLIRVQEALEKARKDRKMERSCSIGVATGRLVKVATPQGPADYFGATA